MNLPVSDGYTCTILICSYTLIALLENLGNSPWVAAWVGARNANITGGDFTTSFDAEKNIKYPDGTPYKHIRNMTYMFDDSDKTQCFIFWKPNKFDDENCTTGRNIICEVTYNCPGV